jgi:hypothetical protein
MDHPGGNNVMSPARFASRIADDVVDALVSRSSDADWWGGPLVVDNLDGVAVMVAVVDVCHDRVGDAMFHGWPELVTAFRLAADAESRGRPSLRLVLPSSAIVGGVRPHDRHHQAFRSDWLVGAPNVDADVRALWVHGRELLELATPAVVVGGDRWRGARGVRRVVRWCHARNACIGFGGVDLGVWTRAGVRQIHRLQSAGDPSSPLREVVELVRQELEERHVQR